MIRKQHTKSSIENPFRDLSQTIKRTFTWRTLEVGYLFRSEQNRTRWRSGGRTLPMLTTANQCTQAEKRMAPRIREFAIAVVFAIRSACHACDSQETVIWAPNCISCGSMLAYEVKHMRETIEKFALGIVFTSASASSIEWLIEHIDQRPAEVDDMASMRCAQMPGLPGFSVDPLSLFRRCTVKDNAMFCWVLRRYR